MSAFRTRLAASFELLRSRGYFVKPGDPTNVKDYWWCCQSCGVAALPDGVENYVFYHQQDNSNLKHRDPPPWIRLCWDGDGDEVRKCLLEAGLAVEWNGSGDDRMKVSLPPLNS